ncbi:hypothetical protein ABZ863_34885, partial [Saccharomonospora sp. NPDC046836]|uniref:hypothetical protein n=1 Tax=Saccharomonospora sp. NPDC046836 TaxID=3156921 RepID=UPI00340BEB63
MTSPFNSSGTPVSSRSTTGTADAIAFPPPLRSTDQAAIATHAVEMLRADALLYLLFFASVGAYAAAGEVLDLLLLFAIGLLGFAM